MSIYRPIWSAADNADLANAIGDVILAWTAAEYDLVAMMAAILNVPFAQASQAYHQISNFRSRTHSIYALIACAEGFEGFKPFVAKYSRLSKTRNGIVHGGFIQSLTSPEIRRIRLNEPSESEHRSIVTKPDDIRQHALAVRAVSIALRKAENSIPKYKAWLGPHPTGT